MSERQGRNRTRNPSGKKKKKPRSVSVGRRIVVSPKKTKTIRLRSKKITNKKAVGELTNKKTSKKHLSSPRSVSFDSPKLSEKISKKSCLRNSSQKRNSKDISNYSQQIMNALDLILQMVPFLTQVNLGNENILENFLQTINKNIDSVNKEISSRSFQILELLYKQNSELVLGHLANLSNTPRIKLSKHLKKIDSDLDLNTTIPKGTIGSPRLQRSPRRIKKKVKSNGCITKKLVKGNKGGKIGNEKGTNRSSLRARKSAGIKRRTRGKSSPRKSNRIKNSSSLTNSHSKEDLGDITNSLKKINATKETKLLDRKLGKGRGKVKGKQKEKVTIENSEIKLAISALEQGILDSESKSVENCCDQMKTLIQEKGSEDWDPFFPRAIKIILLGLNSENEEIRSRISFAFQILFQTFENKFKSKTKMIIDTIIEESKNSSDLIVQELLTYLSQINKTLDTQQALKTLTPYLSTKDNSTLQIIMCILKDLCQLLTKKELETQITPIIIHFKDLLNNSNPKIRRGVVTCIVDFWEIIGQEIESKYLKNVLKNDVLQLIKRFVQQKRKRRNY
ncbi:hypothetical protein M0812_05159 [Anaeramoeba flamelloides]|uniref:TOG domain-containing protein n=1 Tax=Anaeramoeba flamelloides TaxID=1746091 RepID=A0AAV8AA00_9EUKA|nr:hypothetical protein M0812_05159 [Anaeramoeba flamelloides]